MRTTDQLPIPGLGSWTSEYVAVDQSKGISAKQRVRLPLLLWTTAALLAPIQLWAGLPDLIINTNSVNAFIVSQTFASNDCNVVEGCAAPGTRLLLEFNTETRNIGNADLVLGNPTNNPLFVWSPCHGHYHFEGYCLYNLLDASSHVVVTSHKAAFCIDDVFQWDSSANSNRVYNCNYQGIQHGWADVYAAGLPTQWLDITGVPSGNYVLQLIVNPYGLLPESDTNNNTVYVPFFIPPVCLPPANDSFTNAQVLPAALPQSILANNYCATTEPGEPWIYNVRGGASIWFSWTPSTSQVVNLTTLGSDFATLLAVYTGNSISTMSQVAANNNIGNGILQSAVTFSAVAGTDYKITVDGVNGAQGTIQLNFNAPPNDMFANCQQISGLSGTTSGYNIGATKEPGEPAHDSIVGGHSVWYCWTSPTNGVEVIDTIGSDFDTVLTVYTGNVVSNLTAVAADDDSGGNLTSRASFQAIAGTTYHIAVDGFTSTNVATAAGNIVLHWNPPCRLSINLAGNPLQLNLAGGFGSYAVQFSTDLKQWQTFTNFYLGQSSFLFLDPSGLPSAYYRAILMPSP
jgi:hypothetical protein